MATQPSGSGTSSDPYLITNWDELDYMRNDLSAVYELQNDIDQNTNGYSTFASSSANSGDGWDPVDSFSGTLDGLNNSISDLYIDRGSSNNIALIGDSGSSSVTVENVNLLDVDITGQSTVAGIVANSNGSNITDSTVSGTISGSNLNTGGITAFMDAGGNITNCISKVDVSGSDDVGGIIADGFGVTVDTCYSTGNISGSDRVGGLVGNSTGNINNSYSISDVNGGSSSDSGGIVGTLNDNLDQVYFAGTVTNADPVAGNTSNTGTINAVYFDQNTTNTTSSNLSSATALTTSDMQGDEATTNMSGFNFTSNWETVDAGNDSDVNSDGYPILQDIDRATQLGSQNITVSPPDATLVAIDTINITKNSADLEIDVQSIDNTNDITVKAEFRKISNSSFTTISDSETVSSTGTVTLDLPSLSSDQEYEWRGFAID